MVSTSEDLTLGRKCSKGDDKDEDRPARRRRGGHPRDDVVLEEAFNVLMDIVRMTHGEEIPQPKGWWF